MSPDIAPASKKRLGMIALTIGVIALIIGIAYVAIVWYPEFRARQATEMFDDAQAYEHSGDAVKAEEAYRTTIALDPSFGKAHMNLARILNGKGDANGALAEFTLAYEHAGSEDEKKDAASAMGLILMELSFAEDASLPGEERDTLRDASFK